MAESRFAYPVVLDLSGRPVLVVGGGAVALRKARALADAGAAVRVVSPRFVPEFQEDARLECVAETYDSHHVRDRLLVIAATDDEAVNVRVAADARAAGSLINVVDQPALCDFLVPAVLERGLLRIAISTGGAAPSLARRLRERLEPQFGPEYAAYLDVMKEVRRRLQGRRLPQEVRRRLFERLSEDDILEAARQGREPLRKVMEAAVETLLAGE